MAAKRSRLGFLLGVLFIALAIATAWSVRQVYEESRHDKAYAQIVSDIRIKASRLGVYAKDAAGGDRAAMAELDSLQKQIDAGFKSLFEGNPVKGIPASPREAADQLSTAKLRWVQLRAQSIQITS